MAVHEMLPVVSREARNTGHPRRPWLRQMHRTHSTGCSHHDRTGRSAMEPNAALWLGKVTLDPLRSSEGTPIHPSGHASQYRQAQGTESCFYCVRSCSPPRPPPRPRAVAGRSRAAASCSDTAGTRPRWETPYPGLGGRWPCGGPVAALCRPPPGVDEVVRASPRGASLTWSYMLSDVRLEWLHMPWLQRREPNVTSPSCITALLEGPRHRNPWG